MGTDWTVNSLNDFIDSLKQEGDLLEVSEEVSPRFEIAAILGELGEREGPAALFHHVAGFPGSSVAGNILGTRRRLAKAFGVEEGELREAYLSRKQERITPQPVEKGPVQEVGIGEQVNLLKTLPALFHHERDTSPYLTCAVTFARDPESGRQSMGLHRIQLRAEKELAICLATPPLVLFLQKARAMGRPLDVAVAIGPDPAVLVASVTWCPEETDKMEIAGALRQKPVELVQCRTVDLKAPAHCQYLLEGTIHPEHLVKEGIFGESSGIYVEGVESPVIRVGHISHRGEPIYQALQPWSSEDDGLFDLCFGSDIFESTRRDFPFVKDLYLVPGTVSGHATVSVGESTVPMIRSAMASILMRNPFVKRVVVVDEDIDIRRYREVEWAVATRFQADRDLLILNGVQGSVIDPSSNPDGSSCKVGIDATFDKGRSRSFQKVRIPRDAQERSLRVLA